jgi:AraC-like DNA-binding protein
VTVSVQPRTRGRNPATGSLVRSAGLQKFRECVTSRGGDAEVYARRAGLPLEALDTDELLIEARTLATVLEIAAAELRCPDLGLRIGQAQELGMLGPLSVAIQNSSSVSQALECTSRYMFVHARDMSVSLISDPDAAPGVVAVRYSFGPGVRPLPQATEMSIMFFHRAVRFLVHGDYGLRSVDLPHQPVSAVERYEEAFGAPVRFNRDAALLRASASLLGRTLDGVDDMLRTLALSYLERQPRATGPVITGRVRGILDQSLGTGSTELADIAKVMAVHPRTLQRQLAAEGTSFASILEGVRRNRARIYLTTTDMPLAQVCALLGFAEPAVLTHCARRWWGRTPTALRQQERAAKEFNVS